MTQMSAVKDWQCAGCGEIIEHPFAVCWQCGTSRDGRPDPNFQSEEGTETVEAPTVGFPQMRLIKLFWIVALAGYFVAVIHNALQIPAPTAIFMLFILLFFLPLMITVGLMVIRPYKTGSDVRNR